MRFTSRKKKLCAPKKKSKTEVQEAIRQKHINDLQRRIHELEKERSTSMEIMKRKTSVSALSNKNVKYLEPLKEKKIIIHNQGKGD